MDHELAYVCTAPANNYQEDLEIASSTRTAKSVDCIMSHLSHPSMTVSLENLGSLRHAELQLNDFTIVTGENNTSKTYLTHAIYGVMGFFKDQLDLLGSQGKIKPTKPGMWEFDLQVILDNLESNLKFASILYVHHLPQVMSAPRKRFEKTTISVSLPINPDVLERPLSQRTRPLPGGFFLVEKAENETTIRVTKVGEDLGEIPEFVIRDLVSKELSKFIFGEDIFNAFIASTERTGAVTFKNELNLTKNRLIGIAHEMGNDSKVTPMKIWEALQSSAYAIAIRDNLDFLTTVSSLTGVESQIAKNYPHILTDFEDILGGSLVIQDSSNDFFFQPQGDKKTQLTIGECSSSVRSLIILGFYLRYLASPGGLLIIDEPELNLHPKNQRRLTRLLAQLCNAGVRVFITTHSDYIVREVNLLVLLEQARTAGSSLHTTLGYSDSDLLCSDRVSIYTLVRSRDKVPSDSKKPTKDRVLLRRSEIRKGVGICETTFDETISSMNNVHREVLGVLEDC